MAVCCSERIAQGHLQTQEFIGILLADVTVPRALQCCLQSFDNSQSAHEPFRSCLQEILPVGQLPRGVQLQGCDISPGTILQGATSLWMRNHRRMGCKGAGDFCPSAQRNAAPWTTACLAAKCKLDKI